MLPLSDDPNNHTHGITIAHTLIEDGGRLIAVDAAMVVGGNAGGVVAAVGNVIRAGFLYAGGWMGQLPVGGTAQD